MQVMVLAAAIEDKNVQRSLPPLAVAIIATSVALSLTRDPHVRHFVSKLETVSSSAGPVAYFTCARRCGTQEV
jgi:hypothetical protein